MKKFSSILIAFVFLVSCKSAAQDKKNPEKDMQTKTHSKVTDWNKFIASKDDAWFGTEEAQKIADNVLLYQRDIGGWPKNIQMQNKLSDDEIDQLIKLKSDPIGCTADNGATCQEMVFLSKIYGHFPDLKYKNAFLKGLSYLLSSQYKNGGWPQFFPLKKGYPTHITFNDDLMVNILKILKEIKVNAKFNSIEIPNDLYNNSVLAFDKGISCILETQYVQNGVLTAWCAQHDEFTLKPANARAFELASISGIESAKITQLLMSIDNPSEAVIKSVDAAYNWFESTKIVGYKIVSVSVESDKTDKMLVESADAEPIWARFMELDTNKPFFCDRDGIKKYAMSEIGYERRNGYKWYGSEPKAVLKKYSSWKEKVSAK
jgi:PelA/Pel-15E family pectate lyase